MCLLLLLLLCVTKLSKMVLLLPMILKQYTLPTTKPLLSLVCGLMISNTNHPKTLHLTLCSLPYSLILMHFPHYHLIKIALVLYRYQLGQLFFNILNFSNLSDLLNSIISLFLLTNTFLTKFCVPVSRSSCAISRSLPEEYSLHVHFTQR